MRAIRKKNLFLWTLRGKEYLTLAVPSFLILLAIIGVLL